MYRILGKPANPFSDHTRTASTDRRRVLSLVPSVTALESRALLAVLVEPPETLASPNPNPAIYLYPASLPVEIDGSTLAFNGGANGQNGTLDDSDGYLLYFAPDAQLTTPATVTFQANGLPPSSSITGGTFSGLGISIQEYEDTATGVAIYLQTESALLQNSGIISFNINDDFPLPTVPLLILTVQVGAQKTYSQPINGPVDYKVQITAGATPKGTPPPLPDIAMGAESISADSQNVNAPYSIAANALPGPSTIGFYWATGPTFADRIGTTPAAEDSTGTAVGSYTASTTLSSLGTRPANATYILAVADSPDLTPDENPDGLILESNEANNVSAVVAPVSTVTLMSFSKYMYPNELYSNGNYDGSYQISGATLPDNPQLTLGVYWATGSSASDIIGVPVYTAALAQNIGVYNFSLNMSDLVNPPINAQYLVAVLDNQHVLPTSEETKNFAAIGSDVLQAPLSYELDSDAPSLSIAITREQRVYLWLAEYASAINFTATSYNIDPRAIAASIAWEALQNYQNALAQLARLYGPGKIHPSGDAVAVEGTNAYGHYLPVQSDLSDYLKDPTNAITYIAAIMNAYAVEASAVGINLRDASDIGVLVSYYNGITYNGRQVTLLTGPKYFALRVQSISTSPLMPNNEMGQWTENNLTYLGLPLEGPGADRSVLDQSTMVSTTLQARNTSLTSLAPSSQIVYNISDHDMLHVYAAKHILKKDASNASAGIHHGFHSYNIRIGQSSVGRKHRSEWRV